MFKDLRFKYVQKYTLYYVLILIMTSNLCSYGLKYKKLNILRTKRDHEMKKILKSCLRNCIFRSYLAEEIFKFTLVKRIGSSSWKNKIEQIMKPQKLYLLQWKISKYTDNWGNDYVWCKRKVFCDRIKKRRIVMLYLKNCLKIYETNLAFEKIYWADQTTTSSSEMFSENASLKNAAKSAWLLLAWTSF